MCAQNISLKNGVDSIYAFDNRSNSFAYKKSIVPVFMIGLGITQLRSSMPSKINTSIQKKVWNSGNHNTTSIDNYLQYMPALTAYGLHIVGVKGAHSLKEKSKRFLLAQMLTGLTVFPVKRLTHQLRPDGSGNTSFPSGHTAFAFCCATFLQKEYGAQSLWYGVAGYTAAIATGYLRMYNNRHWFSDIVAGAGVGILATQAAYWISPRVLSRKKNKITQGLILFPYYSNHSYGANLSILLK